MMEASDLSSAHAPLLEQPDTCMASQWNFDPAQATKEDMDLSSAHAPFLDPFDTYMAPQSSFEPKQVNSTGQITDIVSDHSDFPNSMLNRLAVPSTITQESTLGNFSGLRTEALYDTQMNSSIASSALKIPRKRKAATLRAKDWEPYKARIVELHISEDRPLEEVMQLMELEFGFSAT